MHTLYLGKKIIVIVWLSFFGGVGAGGWIFFFFFFFFFLTLSQSYTEFPSKVITSYK